MPNSWLNWSSIGRMNSGLYASMPARMWPSLFFASSSNAWNLGPNLPLAGAAAAAGGAGAAGVLAAGGAGGAGVAQPASMAMASTRPVNVNFMRSLAATDGGEPGRKILRIRTTLEWLGHAARVQDRAVLGCRTLARERTRVALANRSLGAHRQVHVLVRITERIHRILALLDQSDVLLQHLAVQDDAAIRATQVLLAAIGNLALGDPGGWILRRVAVEDVPLGLALWRQLGDDRVVHRDVFGFLASFAFETRIARHPPVGGIVIVDRRSDLEGRPAHAANAWRTVA